MHIDAVHAAVKGVPGMSLPQAQAMTRLIIENGVRDILELGFAQGVSTCYLSGALDENGGRAITTIDRERARAFEPNADALLERAGLRHLALVYYEPTSYLWRLMKFLEQDPQPRFDLVYIDGAHDWATDGFAFLLADRMLRDGGLMVLDDLDWKHEDMLLLAHTEWIRQMPQEERTTAQVRKIYDLLVKSDPRYSDFVIMDGWAHARKRALKDVAAAPVRTEVVHHHVRVGLGHTVEKLMLKVHTVLIRRRWRRKVGPLPGPPKQ
jgi:predicted O-methyltransferase YrrM